MKDREKEIYKKAIERLNDAPNNMELRQQSHEDLQRMKKELDLGSVTAEEYFDLEWFYFENWINPIEQDGPDFCQGSRVEKIILN